MPQIYAVDGRAAVVRKIIHSIESHNPGRYRVEIIDANQETVSEPDIRLYEVGSELVAMTIYVETADTLASKAGAARWSGSGTSGELEIFVPKRTLGQAKSLLRRSSLKARLVEY